MVYLDDDNRKDMMVFTVLNFIGYCIRVVYLFVGIAYVIGVNTTKDSGVGETSFIDISKHGIFVILSFLFQLIVAQHHFKVLTSIQDMFITCMLYSLAPAGFLYAYGAFFLVYYFSHDRTAIYHFHHNSLRPLVVTGFITMPYCYITTVILACIEIYVKQIPEYLEWMNAK